MVAFCVDTGTLIFCAQFFGFWHLAQVSVCWSYVLPMSVCVCARSLSIVADTYNRPHHQDRVRYNLTAMHQVPTAVMQDFYGGLAAARGRNVQGHRNDW